MIHSLLYFLFGYYALFVDLNCSCFHAGIVASCSHSSASSLCRNHLPDVGKSETETYVCASLTWITDFSTYTLLLSQWIISRRPLVSLQLGAMLLRPSSSFCTCIPLSTFLSPGLFSKCSLVANFVYGLHCTHCSACLTKQSSFLVCVYLG